VITNPSSAGTYLWRATITPWNPATPAPDAAKTVEVQSIVTLPGKATLRTTVKKVKKKSSVLVSGTVTENGSPVAGATVTILAGGKKVATVKTNANGSFSKSFAIKKATKFQAKIAVAQHDTACVSPLPATSVPGGCVGATVGAYALTTATVSAKPKK
jgi:hypothetical protein